MAPIAKEFAPEYADSIDQGLDYTRKGSIYADKANDFASQYDLSQLDGLTDEELQNLKFSFKKMGRSISKGFKKAAPVAKGALHFTAGAAKMAAPVASMAMPMYAPAIMAGTAGLTAADSMAQKHMLVELDGELYQVPVDVSDIY